MKTTKPVLNSRFSVTLRKDDYTQIRFWSVATANAFEAYCNRTSKGTRLVSRTQSTFKSTWAPFEAEAAVENFFRYATDNETVPLSESRKQRKAILGDALLDSEQEPTNMNSRSIPSPTLLQQSLFLYVFRVDTNGGCKRYIHKGEGVRDVSDVIAYAGICMVHPCETYDTGHGTILVWATDDESAWVSLLAKLRNPKHVIGRSYVRSCRWGDVYKYNALVQAYFGNEETSEEPISATVPACWGCGLPTADCTCNTPASPIQTQEQPSTSPLVSISRNALQTLVRIASRAIPSASSAYAQQENVRQACSDAKRLLNTSATETVFDAPDVWTVKPRTHAEINPSSMQAPATYHPEGLQNELALLANIAVEHIDGMRYGVQVFDSHNKSILNKWYETAEEAHAEWELESDEKSKGESVFLTFLLKQG